MSIRSLKIQLLFYAIASLCLWACAHVPITGRKQLNLLPESQLMASSLTSYQQVLSNSKLITTGADAQRMQKVGKDISMAITNYINKNADHKHRVKGYQWEFNLIDEKTVNAWAMPGGKIAFYQGIMDIAKNDHGVAVIMGHEIAHAIARHGNERLSQLLTTQMGGLALHVALSEKPQKLQELANRAYGIGTQVGVMLPFSRMHESEADKMGLMFMAMAGYDPREAPKFWQRMSKLGAGSWPPEFLSTHPNPHTRINNLNNWMDEAMVYFKNSSKK